MTDEQIAKKEYLIKMFNSIEGEDIGLEEYESIQWFEQRGYSHEEAIQETLNKYRNILFRNDDITDIIVRFKDIYGLFDAVDEEGNIIPVNEDVEQKYYREYVDYLAGRFCSYDFTVKETKLVEGKDVICEVREVYIAYEIVQGLVRQMEYVRSQQQRYRSITYKAETKTDILASHVIKYGFMDLPKVKDLPEDNIPKIIELIAINSVPYAIAMFDYLGFINHLLNNHFKTKDNLNKEMSKWFGVSEREIKGNIAVLNPKSADDRTRYNSCEYQDKVKFDFDQLK